MSCTRSGIVHSMYFTWGLFASEMVPTPSVFVIKKKKKTFSLLTFSKPAIAYIHTHTHTHKLKKQNASEKEGKCKKNLCLM